MRARQGERGLQSSGRGMLGDRGARPRARMDGFAMQEGRMAEQSGRAEASLVAELNDLLQLDHDAVQAYNVAIENLESENLRSTLLEFREDHERHIAELTNLIREHGGIPLELAHLPTGLFKLAVQKVGAMGGDREILLAFKANERQVRDRYHAARVGSHPPEVAAVLDRNAADEDKHYDWVVEALSEMGVTGETAIGRAEATFERVHEKAANAIEGVERAAMERVEATRRRVKEMPDDVRMQVGAGLDRAASAVDQAGTWVEGRDGRVGSRVGQAAHGVAGSLEDAADYVRASDFSTMKHDLEREVEVHPLRMALLALGAGFAVGRLLR